jgi:hypothetical protein
MYCTRKCDVSNVSSQAVFLTCLIDAHGGQDVTTIDIPPGAFMQADMINLVHLNLTAQMVNLLLEIDQEAYGPDTGIVSIAVNPAASPLFTVKTEIDQEAYAPDTGIVGIAGNPAASPLFTVKTTNPEYLNEHESETLVHMVVQLIHLSPRARPDIRITVSFLCPHLQKSDKDDYKKVGRVMKYLQHTVILPLTLSSDGSGVVDESLLRRAPGLEGPYRRGALYGSRYCV